MPRLAVLALALTIAACTDKTPDGDSGAPLRGEVDVRSNETTEVDEPALEATADRAGPAQVSVAGETVPTRAVVTDMESGDRACYVTLRTDGGGSQTVYADYSVCDSNALIGRRVQLEYAPDEIIAESCEGDPECLDTETVALAVVARPIGG